MAKPTTPPPKPEPNYPWYRGKDGKLRMEGFEFISKFPFYRINKKGD